MKLHLPKMLRKAVIACMAAVTGISTTVATGTLLVTMMTRQAQAEYIDGVFTGTDNRGIDLTTLVVPGGKTLTFAMADNAPTDMGQGNYFTAGDQTYIEDIYLRNDLSAGTGLCISNGGNNTVTFTGSVYGYGSISKIGNGTGFNLVFSGDASGLGTENGINLEGSGQIQLGAGATFTLTFKNTNNSTATRGVSGTGDISFTTDNNTLKYEYTERDKTVYITNRIRGEGKSKVELVGGADYVFTKSVTIENFTMTGGSVKFTGGNAHLNNTVLNGDVTIGGVVNFAPKYDMTYVKNLTANGAVTVVDQITLMGAVKLSQTVTNKGTIYLYVDDTLSIDLSGLTPTTNGISGKGATGAYTLFNGGTVAASGADVFGNPELKNLSELFTSDKIASIITGVDTVGKEWSYADGKIMYTVLAADLTWSQASPLTWHVGTEFDGGIVFANDDNVTFAENLGDVTATIDGAIEVSQLTVKSGTDLALAGTGAMEINKAVFENGSGLTIGADREMTWSPVAGTEGAPDTLTVNGKLTIVDKTFNNSAITVDGGQLIVDHPTGHVDLSGNITISNKGTLTFKDHDTLKTGAAQTITINGGEFASEGRTEFDDGDRIILQNGTISGTGDDHGALDFSHENAMVVSSGTSVISAPIRLRNNGVTTTFTVTDGTLSVSEICHKGNGSAGNFAKDGAGTLIVTGNLAHQGTTTVSEGLLQFGGSTQVAKALIMAGGSLGVTADGSATLAALSGAGGITVAEGGVLTLNKVEAGAAGITVTGAVTAGTGFTKTGEGALTLDVLNVASAFNMNGWDKLNINTFKASEGTELVYGAGDVLSIGAVTSAVSLNVFGVAEQLAAGFDTGITLATGQEVQDLKALLSVKGLDSFNLVADEHGRVWLSSTATIQSDWDINWGAELAKAPASVKSGSIDTLASGADASVKLYDLYGNTTYTPREGVVAISLTGAGDANAIVFGGNDAYTQAGVGTVTTHVWIEANEGTYKAIVGGNYANNYNSGSVANFVGNTHIQIDGATVGTIIGGNYKDAQSAGVTGNSYISIFSGDVNGAVVGASLITYNTASVHKGNTNIFVYTPLVAGTSKLHNEPSDMVIGGHACAYASSAGAQKVDGDTNILVDTTAYEGTATFGKHVIGGNYNFVNSNQSVTGSTNVVMDLGSVEMASGMKIIGGNWCDKGSTEIGTTNVTIKSGTYASSIVGGSWLNGVNSGTHTIGKTNVTISGGTIKGMVFGGSSVSGNENAIATLSSGDITILINGEAQLNADIYGGHCINSVSGENKEPVKADIGSVTITLDGADALVAGNIVGGNMSDRNNNSSSTVTVDDVVINLKNGTVGKGVYAAGEANKDLKQTVTSTEVNLSSTVTLSGNIISGGFCGDNAAAGEIEGTSKLTFTDAVEYNNIAATQFKDFNAIELADGANVTMVNFAALNKELAISGVGKLNMGKTAAVELDKLTLSGATVTVDNGIASTAGLSLYITKPSQLILPTKVGEPHSLTLSALDIDMTGAVASSPYVEIAGALNGSSDVLVNLTGVASLAPGEYKLISAESISISADDLKVTMDAEAPEGMEYVVEIVGSNLIFRSSFLSDWVWEGDTNGESNVWSDDENGWKSEDGSPNGQDVYFTAAGEGEVIVGSAVTPAGMNVTGGEYTFTAADAAASIQLGDSGVLSISDGATVNMAMDNADLGGTTELSGKLVLQSDNAIGNSALKFNGGTLVYATLVDGEDNKNHITTDLSKQSGLAADYTGPVKIEVTDAENSVTWNKAAWSEVNAGVDAILNSGIEKTGEGTMNVIYKFGSSVTYAGAFDVQEGTLNMNGSFAGNPVPQLEFSGGMMVAEGTSLNFTFDHQTSNRYMTFAGTMSGSGTISLGGSCGRLWVIGNNSGFAGTLVLSGDGTNGNYNYALFQDGNSFGGENTTVQVNGRAFYFNDSNITTAATVKVLGSSDGNRLGTGTDKVANFTGAWVAEEDAVFAADGAVMTIALAGDLSEYKGTFTSGVNNTWVLGGDGVAGTGSLDMKELNGTGTFKVQYNGETLLNAIVGGTAALRQSGDGTLILAAVNTSSGTLTVDKDKVVQLGDATTAGIWAGAELAGEGSFVLTHGALIGLTTKAEGATLAVKTTKGEVSTFAIGAGGGTIVDLRDSDASLLDSIELVEGSTLLVDDALTVGGEGNTTLDMTFTTDNMTADNTGVAMIQGGNLTIADTEGVNLNLNNADVLTALNGIGKGNLYLQITDGTLAVGEGVSISDVINPNLLGLGVRAQLTDEAAAGGYVLINGDVTDVYFTDNQEGSSADTADEVKVTDGVLGIFAATVVNANDTLTVSATTNINNLNGQEGGNVKITDGAAVTLNNTVLNTGVTGWDPMGADNTLEGSLTGETGTSITVKGEGGSLTVGGALTADTLVVESGDLIANGGADVATLTVADGATMTVANGMELKAGSIQGELKADGNSTSLSTTGQVSVGGKISNMDLTIEDGSVVYLSGDPDFTNKGVASLNSLQVKEGATLMGTGAKVDVGASQPSTIAGKLSGDGLLTTSGDTQLTFDNATGAAGWDVTNNGSMLVDITESGNITLGALNLGEGSDTTLKINSDNGTSDLLTLQVLSVADGAGLTIESVGGGQLDSGEYVIGSVTDGYEGVDELHVDLNGTAFSRLDKVQSYIFVNENGEIVLNAVKSTVNELTNAATHPNAEAGAELLWNSTAPVGGELEDVYNAVNEMIATGDVAGANEAMAAVAGSSTASLGMAFAGDVERQLRAIRNRTTTMGVNQCVVNEGMPYFNAWVNAEGNFGELDQDGLASGYKLDSWGGTVGFDVDVNPNLTLGLAVTAMYGDLTVDGPDMLDGDMDTYYVTAFARYSKRAWTHTFIGTIGMMDGSYERTVNYAGGSYTTKGDTDGMAFGLMYEVGRVFALTEDGDACLQPVFNIAYRHTTVGGYAEDGSDAALDVDDQTLDTITLGAGARFQAVVGENLYNRTSVLELRALAKLDIGDNASEADVALINGTGRGTVESAELGAFGVELGAGLSIPVGDDNDGTIFFDVSAELRSGYSNLNGTVGYRINF